MPNPYITPARPAAGKTRPTAVPPSPLPLCRLCGTAAPCARNLCRRCYNATYHDTTYFAGLKERILTRDAYRCRVCTTKTNVVHHRKPGLAEEAWLITLCPACHATVERLRRLDRYLPPSLRTLWREQHPNTPEQLAFPLESPSRESSAGDGAESAAGATA